MVEQDEGSVQLPQVGQYFDLLVYSEPARRLVMKKELEKKSRLGELKMRESVGDVTSFFVYGCCEWI